MRFKICTLAILIFTWSGQAQETKIIGNGGDVVDCPNHPSRPPIELLDIYEAREIHGFQVLKTQGLSVEENLQAIFERYNSRFPEIFLDWSDQVRDFYEQSLFLPGVELTDIPDSQHVALPLGCKVRQIVIQREPKLPGEKRFTVSLDLWNQLDNFNRAALILHEILLRKGMELDDNVIENSIGTRFLTGTLLSPVAHSYSDRDWITVVKSAGLSAISLDGVLIPIDHAALEFAPNGQASRFEAFWPQRQSWLLIPNPKHRLVLEDEYGMSNGLRTKEGLEFHTAQFSRFDGWAGFAFSLHGAWRVRLTTRQLSVMPTKHFDTPAISISLPINTGEATYKIQGSSAPKVSFRFEQGFCVNETIDLELLREKSLRGKIKLAPGCYNLKELAEKAALSSKFCSSQSGLIEFSLSGAETQADFSPKWQGRITALAMNCLEPAKDKSFQIWEGRYKSSGFDLKVNGAVVTTGDFELKGLSCSGDCGGKVNSPWGHLSIYGFSANAEGWQAYLPYKTKIKSPFLAIVSSYIEGSWTPSEREARFPYGFDPSSDSKVFVQNQWLLVGRIACDEVGRPRWIFLRQAARLKDRAGKLISIAKHSTVHLDEAGRVVRVEGT